MGVVPAGCDHAEARFVEQRSELVAVRNGLVEHVDTYVSAGLGVRARVGGAWGFAATDRVTASGARQALARAIAIAAAQPRPVGAGGAWDAGLAAPRSRHRARPAAPGGGGGGGGRRPRARAAGARALGVAGRARPVLGLARR